MSIRTAIAWSGGKDSAWMFHVLMKHPDYKPVALLTTLVKDRDVVSMHEVAKECIQVQADYMSLPIHWMYVPDGADNEVYRQSFLAAAKDLASEGVEAIAFGDLFLDDIRQFREELIRETGLEAVFPIWGTDTSFLSHAFVKADFKAKIVCLDANRVDEQWLGQEYDQDFLDSLEEGVDPVGENGEFHTLVYSGPIFQDPVPLHVFGRHEHPMQGPENRFMYCSTRSLLATP